MAVLVDSSVWINASTSKGQTKNRLLKVLRGENTVCYSEIVQSEVCQGARSAVDFQKLWDAFLGFQKLPLRDHHWELSAWNYFRCRKKGITISTVDCMIATLAQTYRVPLWSLDAVFKKIQPILGFDVFDP